MSHISEEITDLLTKWSNGDKNALDELIPLVHAELRRLARHYMAKENSGHTLETSALLNEAYIRLVGQQGMPLNNRAHFFAVAAQVMRHILIDHARRHCYAKRGGGGRKVPLEEVTVLVDTRAKEMVALDDALRDLTALDPRKGRIVELRFFGGLSVEETAEALNVSPITIHREWRAAKAWLRREMNKA